MSSSIVKSEFLRDVRLTWTRSFSIFEKLSIDCLLSFICSWKYLFRNFPTNWQSYMYTTISWISIYNLKNCSAVILWKILFFLMSNFCSKLLIFSTISRRRWSKEKFLCMFMICCFWVSDSFKMSVRSLKYLVENFSFCSIFTSVMKFD